MRLYEISNCTIHSGEIYIVRESEQCVRDVMIALDQMVASLPTVEAYIDNLHIYLSEEKPHQQFADLFSCLQLYPSIKDVEFHWLPVSSMYDRIGTFPEAKRKDESNDGAEILVLFDKKILCRQEINNFHGYSTRLPVSLRVWAKRIMKGHSPLSFFVAMDMDGFHASSVLEWRDFFLKAWRDFPRIRFFLFDKTIAAGENFQTGLPNVTVTKNLGYNFLEEFSLCQLSDMYVGRLGKYATAVIGREKPFFITGMNENDVRSEELKKLGELKRIGQNNDDQIGCLHVLSPADLYEQFSHFYRRVRAYDKSGSS